MATFDTVDLFYQAGGSDKEYHIEIVSDTLQDGTTVYKVDTAWGRRGSAAATGNLGIFNTLEKAQKAFNKKKGDQLGKGYQTPEQLGATLEQILAASDIHSFGSGNQAPAQNQAPQTTIADVPSTLIGKRRRILWEPDAPLTTGPNALNGLYHEEQQPPSAPAHTAAPLPGGKIQTNIHPQLLNEIMSEDQVEQYLTDDNWGLQEKMDGKHITANWVNLNQIEKELTTTNKKGELTVSDSQFISNVKPDLADKPSMLLDGEQIGRAFYVYDLLELYGNDLRSYSYTERFSRLCGYFPLTQNLSTGIIRVPLYTGTADKRRMYEQFKAAGKEGVVFKKLNASFTAGKAHQDMLKFKFYAECSCRVSNRETGKHSIGLELLGIGIPGTHLATWIDVGNCTIGQTQPLPPAGSIVEIKYLYAYRGGCLYQPSFKEYRTDVDESECLTTQLKYKAGT